MMKTEWRGFKGNLWQSEVNLRDFIQHNYTSYDGDESFLAEPTQATNTLWGMLKELQKEEITCNSANKLMFSINSPSLPNGNSWRLLLNPH